jgi:hypothetical protein
MSSKLEKFAVKPAKDPVTGKLMKFYKWYKKFDKVSDLMQSKEWEETFRHYYDFDKSEKDIVIGETLEEMNAYDEATIRNELRKCYNDFFYFAHKYLKIMHPTEGLLPAVLYAYQKRVIRCYEKNLYNIISKFRQGGLTTMTVLWALWRCLFRDDQQIMVVSKTDREAKSAAMHINIAVDHLPIWMKPETGKWNEHEKQFMDTGSNLWFYAPDAARGKAITLLIIDEAAFIDNMEKHWKSLYPVVSAGGGCIVISTVNGLGNWYQVQYYKAMDKKNEFNVIELDFWEHPDYNSQQWEETTKNNIGESAWNQEYLRSFLGSGQTYIPPHIIEDLEKFTRNNSPARYLFPEWANKATDDNPEIDEGAFWVWKEPADGHEYLICVDVAEGQGENGDNSAFHILDTGTLEQVAEFYSNRIPPFELAQILHAIGYFYNIAMIVVENAGPGQVILNDLEKDMAYENLFFETAGGKDSPGIKSSKTKRPVFLEALQRRMINGTLKINSKRLVKELNTFIYNPSNKKAEAIKGKHDDLVMALAEGLYVRDTHSRGVPVGSDAPQEMIKSLKAEAYEDIKQEILRGTDLEWNVEDEDQMMLSQEEQDTPLSVQVRRKYDKLLKEFDW